MAASGVDNHKSPSQTASLQRMLDLEQRYKLARLHDTQTSLVSEPVMSFPPQIRQPLQARRRDSRESLAQKQQGDPVLKGTQRTFPLSSLSITIPVPGGDSKKDGLLSDKEDEADMSDDDATPREKTVTFLSPDDDDDAKSEQSSICQSPSWEGYGQKKKKKKQEAEQRRKEKEKAGQELRAAKKKLPKRLSKAPPPPQSPLMQRPASASVSRLDSYKAHSNRSIKSSKSSSAVHTQGTYVPEAWGIAIGAGGFLGGLSIHQASLAKTLAVPTSPSALPEERNKPAATTTSEPLSSAKVQPKANVPTAAKESEPKTKTTTLTVPEKAVRSQTSPEPPSSGVSYPPPSSRTHTLRHTTPMNHSRSNSASAIGVAKMEETARFLKAQNMKSNQTSKPYMNDNLSDDALQTSERGRQKASDVPGYVRRSRALSAERAMAGFMDRVAMLSQSQSDKSRPSSSHSRFLFGKNKGESNGKVETPTPRPDAPRPASPTKLDKDGDQTDYFSFVTKPYTPPSLDPTSPAPGLLSTIRSRISRRSSSASSAPSTARSFKDKAMSAIHLPPYTSHRHTVDLKPPRSVPASRSQSAVHSPDIPHEEFMRLPKPARVLGEFNAETMRSQTSHPASRPSEGSSTSSYHDDSSAPPSPASTPDTSRPQSAKGLSAAIEEVRNGSSTTFLPSEEDLTVVADPPSDSSRDSSQMRSATEDPSNDARPRSGGRLLEIDNDRPSSKGRVIEGLERPSERPNSRGRLLEGLTRPDSRGRILEGLERPTSRGMSEEAQQSDSKDSLLSDADRLSNKSPPPMDSSTTSKSSDELRTTDDEWSRSAMPIDLDAQSFVTSLTSLDVIGSTTSLALQPLDIASSPKPDGRLSDDHSRSSSRHSHRSDETVAAGQNDSKEHDRPKSRDSRKKEKKASSHTKQMSIVKEESLLVKEPTASEAQSAATRKGGAVDVSFLPPLRHEALVPPKSKTRSSTPTSAPAVVEHHPRLLPKNSFVPPELSSGRNSPSAAYLQEARRSAPLVSSPLSNTPRPKGNSSSAPPPPPVTASRPGLKTSSSSPSVTASRPLPPLLPGTHKALPSHSTPQFRIPAQEPEQAIKPIAKMLVQCCGCKFYHDMPSRVYECMAQPDAVVTDRALGVSGAITTSVKCPWCSHNMSTQCCSGFAAVIYLKERLH